MHLREAPQPYHSKPVAPSFQLGYHAPQAASRETPSRKATPPQFHAEHSADGEHWRRITLAPGVELHLRAPLASEVQERVAQLIEMARTLFK